ncbi:MAG: ASKHA domain-containing protein [Candidatus Brocadiia bacterium]
MKHKTHRVTFQPDGRNVFVLSGTKLVEAAGRAGIVLNQPCGGEGTCGKCKVEVLENAPAPTKADERHIEPAQLEDGWRLACQLDVHDDLVVSIPQETRFFEQMVLTEGEGCKYPFQPNIRKTHVQVAEPSVEDQRSDLDRVQDAVGLGTLEVDLSLVRNLPSILRRDDGEVTVVVEGNEIQWVEPGDTTRELWGVAFDIGTTTVVGTLMNLASRDRAGSMAVAARTNPQIHFGDDVVSRISYIEKNSDGLEKLRRRLTTCLNEIIIELCEAADIESDAIYEITAVGNTTMAHIFLGIDPTPIAHAPYVAVLRQAVDVKAREVGLEVNGNANLYVLPNIAGFVGSDTVAMVLASGMMRDDEILLGVDIGTNGEVVLGNRDKLLACSCAAGPAFEGARIRHGMRATEGAISKVVINDEIEVGVIGGGRASGICGSGLVDAVAQLLEAGMLAETGRILSPEELPDDLPEALPRAITTFQDQPAVTLVDAAGSKTGDPILLTQRDIREVQTAKAAIQAGIQVLVDEFGIELDDISRVLLAGGFGNFIRRSQAKRIGLLPPIHSDRIESVGNAASAGAKTALLCRECRQEAETISRTTRYIELANRPEFQLSYTEAMMFPAGD